MGSRALLGCVIAAATGAYVARVAGPPSPSPSPAGGTACCATSERDEVSIPSVGFFLANTAPNSSKSASPAPRVYGNRDTTSASLHFSEGTANASKAESGLLPTAVRIAAACCDLLDSCGMGPVDRSPWTVESTDFTSPSAVASLTVAGKAALQIMRLADTFTPPVDGARAAPVMRLIGFFPSASTDAVYKALMDIDKRFAWDSNYIMFGGYPNTLPQASLTLASDVLKRPIPQVAARTSVCEGDTCSLQCDTTSVPLEDTWLCHKVGSSFLARCGIAPRFFAYERIGIAHELRPPPQPPMSGITNAELPTATTSGTATTAAAAAANKLYDVLYGGSLLGLQEASAASPALREWVHQQKYAVHTRVGDRQVVEKEAPPLSAGSSSHASSPIVHVDMNYQHILLVPIADYRSQLLGLTSDSTKKCNSAALSAAFEALAYSGSVRDVEATRCAYKLMKESARLSEAGGLDRSGAGTLLVMTSANDARVPATLPGWLQRHISSAASHRAYAELTDALKAVT